MPFEPRHTSKVPFTYSTPSVTSGYSDRRHQMLLGESSIATASSPYRFSGGASDVSNNNNNNNVKQFRLDRGDESTDEEIDKDCPALSANAKSNQSMSFAKQPPPTIGDSDTRRKLNIGNSSSQWLQAGGFKSHAPPDEDDEDDQISTQEDDADLNGIVNESASEGSNSSATPKFNAYASLHRELDNQRSRRVSGLYGSEAGSSKLHSTASGLNFAAHLQGPKSLFPSPSNASRFNSLNASSTSLNSLHRRQTSLYGSTSALSDSRLLGGTNSPFYNGRTMFGGASAYSRRASSSQRTLRVPTQIRPSSSLSAASSRSLAGGSVSSDQTTLGGTGSGQTMALSNTAKRILELMNQFTTPLADVKKMSNATQGPALVGNRKRFGESDMLANRSVRLNTPASPYSKQEASRRTNQSSMMATELQVPTMSSLMQMKKLMQNKTEKVSAGRL